MKFHKYIKYVVVLVAVGLCVNPVFSNEQKVVIQKGAILNLSDCIKIALENSPAIKKAKYNYNISKNDVSLAKSSYFPTVGVGAGYNFGLTKTSDIPSNTNDYYSAEASLNQLIWNFGKTNARIRMQKFNKIASLYNFDNTVLNTIFDVKTKYYTVLAAKATMDINRAYVQINERNYQRTKAYYDEGIKSKIDLVNAEVNLSESKITLVQSEKAYKNSLVSLNNSMYVAYAPEYEITSTETFNFQRTEIPVNLTNLKSRDLSKTPKEVKDATLTTRVEKLDVIDNYEFKPFSYTFEECVDLANKNRPDIKAYEATVEAMKQALLYTKREYYPELTAQVGYGFRNQNTTNSLNVGVGLRSNLNIMGKKYEIDSAKVQVDMALNELDLAKQNIYFNVQDAYVNMIQLEKQIPLLAVKVRQTLENFELADGRYEEGLGDYIQLQDAKVNYNNAQHSYVLAVYNYNVQRTGLELLMAMPQDITLKIEDK